MERVRVELDAPGGEHWTWGAAAAEDRVTGTALDFCLVVTQRRNLADTGLQVTGLAAAEWITIAQAFAALMPKGFARPTLKQLDNYWGNFGNALVAVIDKGTDPTKAVADACSAMNKANGL